MAKTFVILSDCMGSGDDALGRMLMKNFLYSLARADAAPARVMFANGGARLTCEGSESVDDLRLLAERGVVIGTCGTCLDHMGLTDALRVGGIGAMPESVALMTGNSDIVTIC